jgi:hypothetical protein
VPVPPQIAPQAPEAGEEEEKEQELVSQDIHLESHELFSQLCTRANLVKSSPRRGLFHSCVNVGEGILRVWRDWLADAAAGKCPGEDILWADSKKNIGLRVRVEEREAVPVGPPFRVGEERDVSYCLFYEGKLLASRDRYNLEEANELQNYL